MFKYTQEKQIEHDVLPKNVKRIGEVNAETPIYIEDYVYTYLHQYAKHYVNEEQVAFLIGEYRNQNGKSYMLINGTVQGKYLSRENGNLEITEKTIKYLNEKQGEYFRDYQVLGWVYTQPGYGILLTSFLLRQHMVHFKDEGQILLIIDPIEQEEIFFQTEGDSITERNGFYIYYERNDAMHEYMLDYKLAEDKTEIPTEEDVVTDYRIREQEKKDDLGHKKFVRMLSLLCATLMILCFVIGMGLVHNMEEMERLKTSFQTSVKEEDQGTTVIEKNANTSVNVINETDSKILDANSTKENTDIQDKAVTTDITKKVEETVVQPVSQKDENKGSQEIEQADTLPPTYTVVKGDSLLRISLKFYKTQKMADEIQSLNGIVNQDKIYIGQILQLPEKN